MTAAPPPVPGIRPRAVDAACVLAFGLYAAVFQWARWQGARPFVFLGGDAALLASWAAALDHPDRFAGDALLSDAANFRYYLTLHVPLVRALAGAAGDYGSAVVSLLGLHVFLQALGFYALGQALFGQRFAAALLAAVALAPVDVPLENWRTFDDPLPRFSFQALLPFLLAAAIRSGSSPRRQIGVMAGAGAMMYVHPVSAPPWALALWLGFASSPAAGAAVRSRVGHAAALAAAFLAASAPFVANAFASWDADASGHVPPLQLQTLVRMMIPRGHWDAGFALRGFGLRWASAEGLLFAVAAAGALAVFRYDPQARPRLATLCLWIAGLVAACVGIPMAEQALARQLGTAPALIDLIRGLRYLVPLALIFCLWPLAVLPSRRAPAGRAAGALLAAAWIAWHPVELVRDQLSCWSRGHLACEPPRREGEREAIAAVQRETPAHAKILPSYYAPSLELRYQARRPLVHCYKDGGVFFYGNRARLVEWYGIHKRMILALAEPDRPARFRAHAALARTLGADYVLVDSDYFQPEWRLRPGDTYQGQRLVWRNYPFALFRVAELPPLAPEGN